MRAANTFFDRAKRAVKPAAFLAGGFGLLLLAGGAAAQAPAGAGERPTQGLGSPFPPGVGVPIMPGSLAKTHTAIGVVMRYTSNARGDVNGMVLDDGSIIRFWPHLAKRILGVARIGDRVEIVGQYHRLDDRGGNALYADVVKNLRTNVRKLDEDLPPRPQPAPTRTATGRVARLTTVPNGGLSGVILDTGTVVEWSPLLTRFSNAVAKGDRIQVTGVQRTTSRGDTTLQAYVLKNLSTRKTVERGGPLPADAPLGRVAVPARTTPPAPPEQEYALPNRVPAVTPAPPPPPVPERENPTPTPSSVRGSTRTTLGPSVATPPPPTAAKRENPKADSTTNADIESRLRALESRMDRLLEEMKHLRHQQQ